jgi:hypothetical protein
LVVAEQTPAIIMKKGVAVIFRDSFFLESSVGTSKLLNSLCYLLLMMGGLRSVAVAAGHTAVELENVLHVEVKHILLQLTRMGEISKKWAGRPLEGFETVKKFVENTKTKTGFDIAAYLDDCEYEKGPKVPDIEFKRLNITKNDELSNWNCTIRASVGLP